MFKSKYILFHDFDEIVLPYKQKNLNEMMPDLERTHKQTTIGILYIVRYNFDQRHDLYFSKLYFEKWKRVPGVNILEHISSTRPKKF